MNSSLSRPTHPPGSTLGRCWQAIFQNGSQNNEGNNRLQNLRRRQGMYNGAGTMKQRTIKRRASRQPFPPNVRTPQTPPALVRSHQTSATADRRPPPLSLARRNATTSHRELPPVASHRRPHLCLSQDATPPPATASHRQSPATADRTSVSRKTQRHRQPPRATASRHNRMSMEEISPLYTAPSSDEVAISTSETAGRLSNCMPNSGSRNNIAFKGFEAQHDMFSVSILRQVGSPLFLNRKFVSMRLCDKLHTECEV
nr:hypothetical protein Iba_chr02fCG7230 [Ipomoea batatas]